MMSKTTSPLMASSTSGTWDAASASEQARSSWRRLVTVADYTHWGKDQENLGSAMISKPGSPQAKRVSQISPGRCQNDWHGR